MVVLVLLRRSPGVVDRLVPAAIVRRGVTGVRHEPLRAGFEAYSVPVSRAACDQPRRPAAYPAPLAMSFEDAVPLDVVAGFVRALEAAETQLFELCGSWSAEGDEPGARAFFAAQAAFHAWRAGEWRRRRPTSVLLGDGPTDGLLLPAGWDRVLVGAGGLGADAARLVVWTDLLVPALLDGMRQGAGGLRDMADGGLLRLVRLFGDDLLEQWTAGHALLARWASPSSAAAAAGALGELLPVLWVGE
jgi:hypothetical protein